MCTINPGTDENLQNQLKRFMPGRGEPVKLNGTFQFPLELEIISSGSNSTRYSLTAVLMHRGTAVFGHYFLYVRVNGMFWYKIDDGLVNAVSSDFVLNDAFGSPIGCSSAYMLQYTKV